MLKTFKCDKCGDVDHVLLDGYPVGDRILEGVLFEIRFTKNGKNYTAASTPSDAEYMRQLNAKRWCKEMVEYAKGTDFASCPKCGEDVDVADLLTKVPKPRSIPIPLEIPKVSRPAPTPMPSGGVSRPSADLLKRIMRP